MPGVTPTGTVRFYAAGIPFGPPVALSTGQASISSSLLPPSQFGVEARYSGDALVNASSGRISQRVACVRYDPAKDLFGYDWRSARTPVGSVQLSVTVPITGGSPQIRTVSLTLRP